MADFCAQCAEDMDWPDNDLRGLTKPDDYAKGLSVVAICEGCGIIQVDPAGRCISNDCFVDHATGRQRAPLANLIEQREK